MQKELEHFRYSFGIAIFNMRTNANITQADLSELSECHTNYISDVELGKSKVGIDLMYKIAKALNTSLSTLIQNAEVIHKGKCFEDDT